MSAVSPPATRLEQLRRVAEILLPGTTDSPAALSLPDFDELLTAAITALGPEAALLNAAVCHLPDELTWDTLKGFHEADCDAFDIVSTTVAGAYFMSPTVLESIGYPTGPRRAAPFDQAVDELSSGVLEPVIARGPIVRTV